MAKKHGAAAELTRATPRSYPIPLKGRLLLACGKCQRKLRHHPGGLSSLKKVLKKLAKRAPERPRVHLLRVPCLKMCPKDGVTVCTADQVGLHQCSIVYAVDDLIQLLASEDPQ